MIRTVFEMVDYVSRVPSILIDQERMILNDRASLIESCRLIMLGRLIKISVGRPEQNKQQQFNSPRSDPVHRPNSPRRDLRLGMMNRVAINHMRWPKVFTFIDQP
jgi:hypothetical protein